MASAKEIKKRRKATQNIHKITKTMGLVATAKLKTANQRLNAFQRYRTKTYDMLAQVAQGGASHPLTEQPKKVAHLTLFVVTSNRGLCGNYNTKMVEALLAFKKEAEQGGKEVAVYLAGRKGAQYLKSRSVATAQSYPRLSDIPSLEELEPIAQTLMDLFEQGKTGQVWGLSTRKVRVVRELLLPFPIPKRQPLLSIALEYQSDLESGNVSKGLADAFVAKGYPLSPNTGVTTQKKGEGWVMSDPEENRKYSLVKDKSGPIQVYEIGEVNPYFWPDTGTMLTELLPLAVKVKIMEMFLQSAISEQTSRMLAMKLATENAEEMIKKLTRQYNRARQTQITKEILEIMGGAEALEEGYE